MQWKFQSYSTLLLMQQLHNDFPSLIRIKCSYSLSYAGERLGMRSHALDITNQLLMKSLYLLICQDSATRADSYRWLAIILLSGTYPWSYSHFYPFCCVFTELFDQQKYRSSWVIFLSSPKHVEDNGKYKCLWYTSNELSPCLIATLFSGYSELITSSHIHKRYGRVGLLLGVGEWLGYFPLLCATLSQM